MGNIEIFSNLYQKEIRVERKLINMNFESGARRMRIRRKKFTMKNHELASFDEENEENNKKRMEKRKTFEIF